MAGSIVGQWFPPGAAGGAPETITLTVIVRKDGSKVGIGIWAPELDDEVSELKGALILPAQDALELLNTTMGSLDRTRGRAIVDDLIALRERRLGTAAP